VSKVSCIIPFYNGRQTVVRAIDSVLASPLCKELVVVVDASPEALEPLLSEQHQAQIKNGRLRIIKLDSNHGQAAARNMGASVATGDYLSFLDQDDMYLPDFYARALRLLEADPNLAAVEVGAEYVLDGKIVLQEPDPRYLAAVGSVPWNVLVRRNIFWAAGGFPVGVEFRTRAAGEDIPFKTALRQWFKVAFLPEKLIRHHIREDSATDRYIKRTRVVDGRIEFLETFANEDDGSLMQAMGVHMNRAKSALEAQRQAMVPVRTTPNGPAPTGMPVQPGMSAQETALRTRVQQQPHDHIAWHALGLMAFNGGNLKMAVQCIEAAIAVEGKVALYHRNIGEMYRRMGQLDKATKAGQKACKLAPADIDAHYNLGLAYTDARNYKKAVDTYRKALKLNPKHNLSWNNLGSALEQMGDKDDALKAYEKALKIQPMHAEAQNNAGAIYSEQGRLDEARAAFRTAIAARPDFVEAHYNLSSLKKYTRDDPHLAMLEGVYANRAQLSDHARIRYCFALGKALDDIGEFDRAFAVYEEGNRLQHALLPTDEARADAMLARITKVFDVRFFEDRRAWREAALSRKGEGGHSRTPIFIVGMPRSGTTLLEQILCSHASVHGAGELIDLNEAITAATGAGAGKPFTDGVVALSEADIKRIGDDYLKRVWKLSPKSAFITDKMPANFFYLGLIHLALPHAKIIHAMRDPMDSCFSCYSRLFNDTMEFAYDQGTLGRYYVRYMKLMEHWRTVLPEGTILDLPYEKMVEDTEAQARRVLEFVGLPWDPACMEFYKNDRLVKTASVAQVRKPIYKTSVARWRHFGRHLQPLLALVRDYRDMTSEDDALLTAPPPSSEITPSIIPSTSSSGGGEPGLGAAEQAHIKGIEHYRAGRFDEALATYDQALALHPCYPACLNSKGFVLQDLNRMDEALSCFEKAVQHAPEMAMARLNLGMAQLKLGDWEHGWENYEARWTGSAEAGAGTLNRPVCPLPLWNGEDDTTGKRLLVITEQGFGDTFQFARYLPLVASRFAKVGFVCSQPTQRLMEWAFGDAILTLTRMPSEPEGYEAWDLQCPLMSLPRAFGTRPDNIPAETAYLSAPDKAVAHWRERLELASPKRFRIGIAWAGRKAHQYDARRSLSFERIVPLLKDARITWVSLQKWAPEDQRPEIPPEADWIDWTEELSDFADTAALLSNLDMVLSIDSSMVHLAAALGRPVWMLDRFDNEWRWLRHRTDSPWYPSLRIFRQPAFGDWDSVLTEVVAELARLPQLKKSAKAIPKARPKQKAAAAPAPVLATPTPAGGPLTPEQAMQIASQLQSAGRPQEAERILRQILQANPRHAHALHLLGVVAYQAGQAPMALQLIGQAIEVEPNVALFHSNLAEMNRQQGRVQDAIRHGERAVTIEPSMASAQSNLGIAYYDAKDYDRAEACHQKALTLAPQLLQSLNNLGSIERAHKDLKAAAEWYRKALAIQPDFLESLSNLGAVLVEDDQADAAQPSLERALYLQPNYPEALCNLGLVRLKQERADEASALLRRSLQLRPGYPEALVGLARALHEQDQFAEAEAMLMQAVENAPDKGDAWCQLGSVRMEMGEPAKAEAAYTRALEIDPNMADALTGLGNLRLEEGKIDDSVVLLQRAIGIDADNLGARFHLTQARKVKPGDENLAVLEAKANDVAVLSGLGEDKRISLHYALGKAYDDIKDYDRAFPHFLEGARLKRAKLHYDANADAARIDRLIASVDRGFIERLHGGGDPSDLPVFVLGMPRSGTTLTEQIIASHPEVQGAGELRDFMEVVQQPSVAGPFLAYPDNLAGLTSDTLARWGADYVARQRARDAKARRVTDKMPANYLALGLIPLILPNARIVHVKRNPVDTCVSCFTRLFNKHQDATYDLYELGRHYANYARLMNHWRQMLPPSSFMEVQYEDIVADQEAQARRLIDWVGLEWNEACLEFHKTKRNIRTASVTQVRQPIYTSSVERWRNYEKYLGPLLEGLGEFASKR
jgi:tetratricopeptide (TPR) repeat protein